MRIVLTTALMAIMAFVANGQGSYLITSNSVGGIKLGMTVAQARKAMPGFRLKRTSDGDGQALIEVSKGGKETMTVYAGEDDPDARINENAKIEHIKVWDSRYRTVDGIHPKMLVKEVERKLGKVKEVFMSEIESREYATFRKKTKGLMFRIDVNTEGKYLSAGIYPKGNRRGSRCVPTAFIIGIEVSDYFN